jgi:3-dehydroquinate dehydratase-2
MRSRSFAVSLTARSSTPVPYVEVHVSNIFAREPERRHSVLAAGAKALLAGFGPVGYELALRGLVSNLSARG